MRTTSSKLNAAEHDEMFAAESATGSKHSAPATGHFACRASWRAAYVGPDAYLLLEYVELRPLRDGDTGRAAGSALADLHGIEGRHFGWRRDNFIGSTPQRNGESDDWPTFFASRRLKPQLELARERGIQH